MRLWTRIELILENGISKSKDGDETVYKVELILENGISKSKDGDETVDKDRIDTGERYQ